MKKNDKKTLHDKSVAELVATLKEKRQELVKTAMELRLGRVKNVHALKALRSEIATILTLKKAKEITNNG